MSGQAMSLPAKSCSSANFYRFAAVCAACYVVAQIIQEFTFHHGITDSPVGEQAILQRLMPLDQFRLTLLLFTFIRDRRNRQPLDRPFRDQQAMGDAVSKYSLVGSQAVDRGTNSSLGRKPYWLLLHNQDRSFSWVPVSCSRHVG